ncbi:MAG: hypothetical protein ABIZ36_04585 [Gemmatimonadaceae bacterium]
MTVPETSAPEDVRTRKVDALIVDGVISSLNVTRMIVARGTAFSSAGVDAVTRGPVTSGGVTVAEDDSADNAEKVPSLPVADTVYV